MKFTFDRDAMIKEITVAQEIITNKSPVSILSNILVIAENDALTIKATDSTVKFTTTMPVDIQEEGRTTIFCDKFMSILSSLPSGETVLEAGNTIGVLLDKKDISKLSNLCGSRKKEIKKIVLIGAGRIGTIIAEKLIKPQKSAFGNLFNFKLTSKI